MKFRYAAPAFFVNYAAVPRMCISSSSPSTSSSSTSSSPLNRWQPVFDSSSISDAVKTAAAIFRSSGVSEPDMSAAHLARSSFRSVTSFHPSSSSPSSPSSSFPPRYVVPHTHMASRFRANGYDREEMEHFINLCNQRLDHHTPIQYLVGDWDFHHISLIVRPPTLIPRPETEALVELVLAHIDKIDRPIVSFMDVGCGSGAITLALLSALYKQKGKGNTKVKHVVALDPCRHAIDLMKENVNYLQATGCLSLRGGEFCKLDVIQADIQEFEPQQTTHQDDDKWFDFIVSNPPYIPTRHIKTLDKNVRLHESHDALDGGPDGLDIVKVILQRAKDLVRKHGCVFVEVDESHPDILKEMEFDGVRFVNYFDDWYGRRRFVQWEIV